MTYVIWRTFGGDDISKREKYIFIHWVGEKVKTITRVTSQAHGASLKDLFGYFHISINGRNFTEVNKELIH